MEQGAIIQINTKLLNFSLLDPAQGYRNFDICRLHRRILCVCLPADAVCMESNCAAADRSYDSGRSAGDNLMDRIHDGYYKAHSVLHN